MSDINMTLAKKNYDCVCRALDGMGLKYNRHDEELAIDFGISGKDIPMSILILVDAERQLVRLFSRLPFKMSEEKRMEGAIAAAAASYALIGGSFDYNIADGTITYRTVTSYRDSEIGEGLYQYLVTMACKVVDEYNDKFLAIDKGFISITDFIASK